MKNEFDLRRKLMSAKKLRDGKKQFEKLIRPSAYVFVNNICLPIVNR